MKDVIKQNEDFMMHEEIYSLPPEPVSKKKKKKRRRRPQYDGYGDEQPSPSPGGGISRRAY